MSGLYLQPACGIVGGADRAAQKSGAEELYGVEDTVARISVTVGVAAGARRATACEDGGASCGATQFGGE